ncbi:cytochrome P450 94B3-like [Punica granatum]|uniref:Uncharacterized protein n=2 Tax=Punica granatum TaxID=22663 RepID=A0A218VZ55_PUNGR|nr:cytochrome P450 94B3-like [Punica granatum]OWM65488.1 hypothetical protein CDL15_Pgr009078 [Punica granatum]PKI53292.1 hypothetical protein CRG98_026320 [Punica granatum]
MFIFFLLFLSSLPLGFLLFSAFLSLIRQRRLYAHFIGRFKRLVLYPSSSSHPGPPSYPVIGCLISFYQNRGCLLDWYTDLLSESATNTIVIRRLGARRTIVTANPENIEHLLKTNFANYPKGKPFTDILGDFLGRGIFNADGDLWHAQRKVASHEFSTKSLREFVVRTLESEFKNRLLPLLEESAESRRILDLQDILGRFAFDTVCQISLGTDPHCLDLSRPVPPLVMAFNHASKICAMRGMAPVFLVWQIKCALNIGSERELAEAVRVVHTAVSEIIRSKRISLEQDREKSSQSSRDGDLLTRLLVAGHDQEMVRDMVISFIMAGRDTTSSAMTWLFWLLADHPRVEKMISSELSSLLDIKKGGRATLDFEVLKEMKFLKACLCESMRLYPPVAWDSKHAAAGDVLPDGTSVRKGDRVTYFPYGMGRMKNLWGEDRLEFKPERWFDGLKMNEMKAVSPFRYPVFQAGPRVCLGKEMAFIQMKYVVASILSRFDIRPVDSENRPVFVPLLTAHMAGGLRVMVRRRIDHVA